MTSEHQIDVAALRADDALIESLRRGQLPHTDSLAPYLTAWVIETRGETIMDTRTSVQKIGRNAKQRERQVQSRFGSSRGDYEITYRRPRPSPNVPRQTSTLRTTGANVSAARQALRDSGFKVTSTKQTGGGLLGWLLG